MSKKNETRLTEDDVREEHMQQVRPGPHWLYLFGVVGISFVVMLGLIAVLGGTG